ncbi:MAG: flagellar basal body rod protein FlgB [Caldimicrobium sp.]
MWGSFQKVLDTIKVSLKLRSMRHQMLSSNIANVDTPGYRRKDISFERVMQMYLSQERKLKVTDKRHFSFRERTLEDLTRTSESLTLGTPNNVSLEEEMVNLTENQLLYESTLQALSKELERLKEIITEGGR